MNEKIKKITYLAILISIEAIMCFTPLGHIPIGNISITLSHIPVIIAAVLFGTDIGGEMGLIFGIFSFIIWSFAPPSPIAFVFTPFYSIGGVKGSWWSIVICFLPKIFMGVSTGLIYKFFAHRKFKDVLTYGLSCALGTLIYKILTWVGIYIFFYNEYIRILSLTYGSLLKFAGAIVIIDGIIRSVLSGIIGFFICKPIVKVLKSNAIK